MSTHKVEIVKIDSVSVHPNADRLELAQVFGWQVVIGKAGFKAGDLAIYIPVDSVLPGFVEEVLFPVDSKIKLHKSRVRSIKIRGAMSQGMLVPMSELGLHGYEVGDDVTDILGITKYEPPEPGWAGNAPGTRNKKKSNSQVNPGFSKYTDIENIKWYNDLFKEGEPVYISEKLHGTSARYGWVPFERNYTGRFGGLRRWWDNTLLRFGLKNSDEFVWGSRNVQLQTGKQHTFYEEDVYTKILNQENLRSKLKKGESVYGEIVGDGIQKNYSYGCGQGEHKFFAYDVKVDGRWLDHDEFVKFCDERGIARVPELYVGPYTKDIELKFRDGDSTIGNQKVREGVVIKPVLEETTYAGRKVLKSISDAYYLDPDNTDFH